MSHFGSAPSIPRTRLAGVFLAACCALALASCARSQPQQEASAAPAEPQPAYCEPRRETDCEFRGVARKTIDPAEFARLKLAYERRCLRHAEKTEQERLHRLQASGVCTVRPAPALAASR